jgi:hypothetical protein
VTDADFLAAFEAGEIAAPDHAAHVRAAYVLLRECSFPEALRRLATALRRIAEAAGRADRYHETVTVANLALIQRHLDERGAGDGWEEFARLNPELFDRRLLEHFYPVAMLNSAQARRIFLLPPGRSALEP